MRFKQLSSSQKEYIKKVYEENPSREKAQLELADHFGVIPRTIRNWANKLEKGLMTKNIVNPSKILIYDIETCRVEAKVWWTGKQYVGHKQLETEPKIITIAWKWLGEDKVHSLTWDKKQSDKKLVKAFIKEYNKADMVIGQNNDRFDNRWLNARAMKYGFDINVFVKSFDIMKQTKRLFRLPSYSMAYITEFLGVTLKQSHEGIHMWDMIESGTEEQQEEYLQKMVDYNVGDIVSTEEMYLKLRKYMGHKVHFGVLHGGEKWSCPSCGSEDVRLYKTSVTPAGTLQRVMICNVDKVKYKISNKQYMNFLEDKMRTSIPQNSK